MKRISCHCLGADFGLEGVRLMLGSPKNACGIKGLGANEDLLQRPSPPTRGLGYGCLIARLSGSYRRSTAQELESLNLVLEQDKFEHRTRRSKLYLIRVYRG